MQDLPLWGLLIAWDVQIHRKSLYCMFRFYFRGKICKSDGELDFTSEGGGGRVI
jgi:hypothetical protein